MRNEYVKGKQKYIFELFEYIERETILNSRHLIAKFIFKTTKKEENQWFELLILQKNITRNIAMFKKNLKNKDICKTVCTS